MQTAEARPPTNSFELRYPKLQIHTDQQLIPLDLTDYPDDMASSPPHDLSDFSDSDDPYEIVSHTSGQTDDEDDEGSLVEAPSVVPSVFPVRTNNELVDSSKSPKEIVMRFPEMESMHKDTQQDDKASVKSFESDVEDEQNMMSTPTIVPSLHQSQEHIERAEDDFDPDDHIVRFIEKKDEDDNEALIGTSMKMSSMRMPMLANHLPVEDSFRIFYSGHRQHLPQVLWKVGQMLMVSAKHADLIETGNVEEYNILDISPLDFTTNPEVEITPSFGPKLIVEVSETGRSELRKIRGARPDLAIIVQQEATEKHTITFRMADGTGIRLPTIQVSASSPTTANVSLPKVIPILSTPIINANGTTNFVPVGLETFLGIDSEQLNRHVAFLMSCDYTEVSRFVNPIYYDLLDEAYLTLRDSVGAAVASAKAATTQLGTACELACERMSSAVRRRLPPAEVLMGPSAATLFGRQNSVRRGMRSTLVQGSTVWLAVVLTIVGVVLPMIFVPGMTVRQSGLPLSTASSIANQSVPAVFSSATSLATTTPLSLTVCATSSTRQSAAATTSQLGGYEGTSMFGKLFKDGILPFDTGKAMANYISPKHGLQESLCAGKWSLQFDDSQLVMTRPARSSWSYSLVMPRLIAVDGRCQPLAKTLDRVNATRVNVDLDAVRLNNIKSALLLGKDVDGVYLVTGNALRKVTNKTEHFESVEDAVVGACSIITDLQKLEGPGLAKSFARFSSFIEGSFDSAMRRAQDLFSLPKSESAHHDVHEAEVARILDVAHVARILDNYATFLDLSRKMPWAAYWTEPAGESVDPNKLTVLKEIVRNAELYANLHDGLHWRPVLDVAYVQGAMIANGKKVEASLTKAQVALAHSMEDARARIEVAAARLQVGSVTSARKAATQARAMVSRLQRAVEAIRGGGQNA
jgi:hypothetical protein